MTNDKSSKPPKRRKPGRPKGKRSDPKYIFLGGYIRKTTYRSVKKRLFQQDKEISELLEELLQEWLNQKSQK